MKEKFKVLWGKLVNWETISYVVVGVFTTAINYIVDIVANHFLLTSMGNATLAASIANVIAWIVAVIFAFFTNKIWVFKSKDWSGKKFWFEFSTFMGARALSGVFEEVFIIIVVGGLGIPNWLAKIISNVVVVIVNYIASKLVIFRKPKNKESDLNETKE